MFVLTDVYPRRVAYRVEPLSEQQWRDFEKEARTLKDSGIVEWCIFFRVLNAEASKLLSATEKKMEEITGESPGSAVLTRGKYTYIVLTMPDDYMWDYDGALKDYEPEVLRSCKQEARRAHAEILSGTKLIRDNAKVFRTLLWDANRVDSDELIRKSKMA